MTSTDALCAIILPWAKEKHAEKYTQTLAVAREPTTFRRYLVRLIEIRCEEEGHAWTGVVPLDVLEESAVTMSFRAGDTVLEVKGRLAAGDRVWSFAELAMLVTEPDLDARKQALAMLVRAKTTLDLVHVR